MKNNIVKIVFFLVAMCIPVKGKGQTAVLERLVNDKVSPSGGVVSFYHIKSDDKVLIVNDIASKKTYRLPNIDGETYLDEEILIGKAANRLYYLDLELGKVDTFPNVSDFHYNPKSGLVLHDANTRTLSFVINGKLNELADVEEYGFSATKNHWVIADGMGKISWYEFTKGKLMRNHTFNYEGRVKKILWDHHKKRFVLFGITDEFFDMIEVTAGGSKKQYGHNIVYGSSVHLDTLFSNVRLLSEGDIALGFKYGSELEPDSGSKSKAEVWQGRSKGVTFYINEQVNRQRILGIYKAERDSLILFNQPGKWMIHAVGTSSNRVLSYERNKYEDFQKMLPLVDLEIFSSLENKSKQFTSIPLIASGLFLAEKYNVLFYFKDKNWFAYNPETAVHVNITHGSQGQFYMDEVKSADGYLSAAGEVYGTGNNNLVLLHDINDLWSYDISKNILKRLTRGREEGRVYRLVSDQLDVSFKNWSWSSEKILKNTSGLYLHWVSTNHMKEGISYMEYKNGYVKELYNHNAKLSQIRTSTGKISFVREKASMPPEIVLLNLRKAQSQVLYSSNGSDILAEENKTEYVEWLNTDNEKRGALVRYPVGYDETVKYPVIVNIYELKFKEQHIYQSPADYKGGGFNYRHYTDNGYIVIEPDIHYKLGDPGFSALECVEDALDMLFECLPVQKDNVGLIGHSFGSYQTNFIITQSNKFKAAVSSAGIADLESWYLTMGWNTMQPEFWRMEDQQFRMGSSLFEIPEKYRQNSPVTHIQNVNTPLLVWVGKEDYHVNWSQSVMMFLALKRLGKDVNLILYPEEGHVLIDPANQKDVGTKVREWFDYHLKKAEEPYWIKEGLH